MRTLHAMGKQHSTVDKISAGRSGDCSDWQGHAFHTSPAMHCSNNKQFIIFGPQYLAVEVAAAAAVGVAAAAAAAAAQHAVPPDNVMGTTWTYHWALAVNLPFLTCAVYLVCRSNHFEFNN